MAGIPGIPQNLSVQSGNQQLLVSWNLVVGATSYQIQRSLDNVTFTALATVSGSPLATTYLDTAVTLGVNYWYKVASTNTNGTSPYCNSQANIPVPTAEFSLSQIRLAARQRADRVNSNFVTDAELNSYINQSMFELYDLLITVFEDYFLATPVQFATNGSQWIYPLPDGTLTFQNGINPQVNMVAPPFYKLKGVDLALETATNAYVTINKFNFINRNRFVYPNTASTIYGVFNLQYRLMGNTLEFIPTPTAGQNIRIWYVPRLPQLLNDTDTTTIGISGWIEYVIVKAAYYALTKEESDTSALVLQLEALTERIMTTASNRDEGQPDTISDTRAGNGNGWGSGFGGGWNGGIAGW